ncbi:Protein AUXIN SIGNALING F-BOX 3 [Asimina triloba]
MFFQDEILVLIFNYLSSHQDRNSASQVCKSWFEVERWCRRRVFVRNCYTVGPARVVDRFPRLVSLTVKGRPRLDWLPRDWGGSVEGWIAAVAESCPLLEELRLKRMVVSDDSLKRLSWSFPDLKALVLFGCRGFTTDGLAVIAANCRNLRELDLQESKVDDRGGDWLSCFPDSFTLLVSLNITTCRRVNFGTLERLVARCSNLRSLRLGQSIYLQDLLRILVLAPALEDLGTGCFADQQPLPVDNLHKCESVKSLSGFWGLRPNPSGFIYAMCSNNLTFLNLCNSPIEGLHFVKLILECRKLERLWVLECVGDIGLKTVSSACKELQELKVFQHQGRHFFLRTRPTASDLTEEGLVSVSIGCPKLQSLQYFCRQMTNAALFTVARNCPHFTHFRLYIEDPEKADPVMRQPLDEGFGAIVRSCKHLKSLSLSALLTDRVFLYIGMYAEQLEKLSVAFADRSAVDGMAYVLNGCKKLRKLGIRTCPFGDSAGLLASVGEYERLQSLWVLSCGITLRSCKLLAKKTPGLNVEIITGGPPTIFRPNIEVHKLHVEDDDNEDDDQKTVDRMYAYRTLNGPIKVMPR